MVSSSGNPSAMCSGHWGCIPWWLCFDRILWKQLSGCVSSAAGDDYFEDSYSYLAWTKLLLTQNESLVLGRSLSRAEFVFWEQDFCENQQWWEGDCGGCSWRGDEEGCTSWRGVCQGSCCRRRCSQGPAETAPEVLASSKIPWVRLQQLLSPRENSCCCF